MSKNTRKTLTRAGCPYTLSSLSESKSGGRPSNGYGLGRRHRVASLGCDRDEDSGWCAHWHCALDGYAESVALAEGGVSGAGAGEIPRSWIERDWMSFEIGKDNGDPRGREAEEWPMRLG